LAFYNISFTFSDLPRGSQIVDLKATGCNVILKWTPPQSNNCPILFYTVRYRKQETTGDAQKWTAINITDPTVSQHELMLSCTTTYEFQVTAWNKLGGLPFLVPSTTTGGFATKDDVEDLPTSGNDLLFVLINLS